MSLLFPRVLGKTGVHVSALGLGTVKIGRNQKVKYPGGEGFQLPDDQAVQNLLSLALDKGINLLDTSPAYGLSEERLGKLLGLNRNKWFLTTKAGEDFSNGESHYDFSFDGILKSVERSLKRLKTDCVDLVLLHCDRNDLEILKKGDAFRALLKAKQEGKAKFIGVSTTSIDGGLMAVEQSDVVMVSYNVSYQAEWPVIIKSSKNNAGVLIKKGLLSGHAGIQGEPSTEQCLRELLSKKEIHSTVVGTTNPVHLIQNIDLVYKILSSI